jgi:hypothetical protein
MAISQACVGMCLSSLVVFKCNTPACYLLFAMCLGQYFLQAIMVLKKRPATQLGQLVTHLYSAAECHQMEQFITNLIDMLFVKFCWSFFNNVQICVSSLCLVAMLAALLS